MWRWAALKIYENEEQKEDRALGTEELETGMVNYNERQRQQRRAFKVEDRLIWIAFVLIPLHVSSVRERGSCKKVKRREKKQLFSFIPSGISIMVGCHKKLVHVKKSKAPEGATIM